MKCPRRKPIDVSGTSREDGQRLLLEHLLDMLPGPYAVLVAYLDERGRNRVRLRCA
jgi:hypothetical protein